MTITADKYPQIKMDMRDFLLHEINQTIAQIGSREKLSEKLGHSCNYVQMILKRQSFSALERLWLECQKMK